MKRRFSLRYKVLTFRNFETDICIHLHRTRTLRPASPQQCGDKFIHQSYVSSELCYVANNRDLPTPEYLEGVYDTSFDNATRLEHSPHGGSCVCVVSTEKQCT